MILINCCEIPGNGINLLAVKLIIHTVINNINKLLQKSQIWIKVLRVHVDCNFYV